MSIEVGKIGEQNSALLSFLAGRWTTRFAAYVHSLGTKTGIRAHTYLGGAKVYSLFQHLPDGGLAGKYIPIENSTEDDESTADCFLQLGLDRSDNSLVAYLGKDKTVPGIKGLWDKSVLRFRGDFHDGITMWELFQEIKPEVTTRPSAVSLIVCQVSEAIWLLDVVFEVEQSYPSQTTPVRLRCRLEFWHFRQRPSASTPLHPQDIEESFDEILQKCEEVTQDVEFRLDEIEDLIASLEDSRSKCEGQLRPLGELKSQAESGKDDANSLDDEMREAILELHQNPLVPAEGSAVAGDVKGALARAWSELSASAKGF